MQVGLADAEMPTLRVMRHGAPVTCCAYAPHDQSRIASGGGRLVIIWDLSRAQPSALHRFEDAAFLLNPHAGAAAAGPGGGGGGVNGAGGENGDRYRRSVDKLDVDGVSALDFSSDGAELAVAGGEQLVVWHVKTGGEMHKYQHQDKVCCVAFSPDGGMVCAGGTDWKLTIRDLTTEVVVRNVRQVGVIDVSVDGNAYAHNDWNGETVVRGLRTNEVMCYTHKKCNLGVLSPQMTYFAVKTDEHSVYVFRLKDEHGNDLPAQGQLLREHSFDSNAWAKATRLAAAGDEKTDKSNAESIISASLGDSYRHEIDCISFSPDDQWLALGVCTSAVLINMATGEETVHPQGSHVSSISFYVDPVGGAVGGRAAAAAAKLRASASADGAAGGAVAGGAVAGGGVGAAVIEPGSPTSGLAPPIEPVPMSLEGALGADRSSGATRAGFKPRLRVAYGLQFKGFVWLHDVEKEARRATFYARAPLSRTHVFALTRRTSSLSASLAAPPARRPCPPRQGRGGRRRGRGAPRRRRRRPRRWQRRRRGGRRAQRLARAGDG